VTDVSRWLVFGWATLVLVFVYWQFREAGATGIRAAAHEGILDGTALSPYRYRLLAPWTTEAVMRLLAPLGERRAFHLAYLAWNTAWTYLTFALTFRFLRRWHAPDTALVATLLLPLALVAAFAEQWYAPWSVAETPLFLAGLLAVLGGRTVAALALVAVASLNRETALYLPLAWMLVASAPDSVRRSGVTAAAPLAALAVWIVIYGALRWALGAAPAAVPFDVLLRTNLDPMGLAFAAIWLALLLGPVWLWAARGAGAAPAELARLCWMVVPVAVLYLAFGIWREVRILMPLVPLLLALAPFGWARAAPDPHRGTA
jgi:hypothetical protein